MKTMRILVGKRVWVFAGLCIAGTLACLVPMFWTYTDHPRGTGVLKTNLIMGQINGAIQTYVMLQLNNDNILFPASLDDLIQFTSTNEYFRRGQVPLRKEDFQGSWGEPIEYESDGHSWYIIRSYGRDKTKGTADDFIKGEPGSRVEEEQQKARQVPAVVSQKADAAEKATAEPIRPPVAPGKKTPGRVAAKDGLPEDEPTETDAAPWQLPLLIGIVVLGAIMAWLHFGKRRKRE